MELRINEYQLPTAIEFNFVELKAELQAKTETYKMMIYGDDQIKQAKADRADLNKLKKALNDERIRREKEYMAPFNEFKAQIGEIIAIIDEPAKAIDAQIKAFEDKKTAEKQAKIEELFNGMEFPDYVTLQKIFDGTWLNSTVSINKISEAMAAKKKVIEEQVSALVALPEYSFEAFEFYKNDLNMAGALTQASKLVELAKAKKAAEEAKAKAEEEAKKRAEEAAKANEETEAVEDVKNVEEPIQPIQPTEDTFRVSLEVILTTSQGFALRNFFEDNNIRFKFTHSQIIKGGEQ